MKILLATCLSLLLLMSGKLIAQSTNGVGYYTNPVLPGDHPDATLMRVGDDFYSAGSSFHFSPFLPIHHSKDLVHWEVISRVVPANWSGLQSSAPGSGTWQGALAQFGGFFWCYFSNHTGGGQYFCKATSMTGPWSAPVKVSGVIGYDNSIFVDDDGTPYMVMKNGANLNRLQKLDKTTGNASGPVINMDWLNAANNYGMAEGPVMCKRNNRYYYFFAGDIYGKQWVISSASLTSNKSSWSTPVAFFKNAGGMASTFKGPNHITQPIKLDDGTWWCLSHAYENNGTDYSAQGGRQGLLHQVFWDANGTPYANNPVGDPLTAPNLKNGTIDWFVPRSDNFSANKLNVDWHFFGTDNGSTWSVTDRPGYLRIKPGNATKDVCKKDMYRFYDITTMVDFDATGSNQEAGIRILSGKNDLTIKLCSGFNGSKKIKFYFGNSSYEVNNTIGSKVWLKMQRQGQTISGFYSADGVSWTKIGNGISVASLDKTQPAYNSWVCNSIALYASNKNADFDLFMFRDGFQDQRAEGYVNSYGVTKATKAPGTVVTNINNGDWIMLPGLDLGTQTKLASGISINASGTGGSIEVWQGNIGGSGKLLGTVTIPNTGGSFKNHTTSFSASGQHDIYLNFKGGSGNLFDLNTIKFLNIVGILPTVSITAPTNNSNITTLQTVLLTANAADADGNVAKVEFYDGLTLLGIDTNSPYTYSWSGMAAGTHVITAIATDNTGLSTTSSAITVIVEGVQAPYNGIAHPIPGVIQMEEYDLGGNGTAYKDDSPNNTGGATFRVDEDVDLETCTDTGAGYNIGFATAGEWVEYTVEVSKAGAYSMDLRVACNGDARTIGFTMDGVSISKDIAITNTGDWQKWETVKVSNVDLKAGKQILRMTIGASDYVNINYVTFTLNKELKQEPFKGTAHAIPGKIEAEEYDLGGEGLAYHEANTNGNQGAGTLRNDEVDIEVCTDTDGGFNLGYTLMGEWEEYTVNVAATGQYNLDVRVAKDGEGGTFHIEMDGVNITNAIAVPNTGGWQVWQTVTIPNIPLISGEHIMRIAFDSDYTNLNYVAFKDNMITTGVGNGKFTDIQMYPNPFGNRGITLDIKENFTYQIIGITGEMLEEGIGTDKSVVGETLKAGTYLIRIETTAGASVKMIVRQ